jgi:hypothetical protein
MVLTSTDRRRIARKHKTFRTVISLNTEVRRALGLLAALTAANIDPLIGLDPPSPALVPAQRDDLKRLYWMSVLTVTLHQVVATGISKRRYDQ